MATAQYLDVNPPYDFPEYKITEFRAPQQEPVMLPAEWFAESGGPNFARIPFDSGENDLTAGHVGEPQGQRVVINGRVLDRYGSPVPHTLIEVWQANASGAYADPTDPGFNPLDPNFTGKGRCMTDEDGRFQIRTVKPAAYPGALGGLYRPTHIHLSVFGPDLSSRLITQIYFEGEPLIDRDPVVQSVPDARGVERLVAKFDSKGTEPGGVGSALAYDYEIVLRGVVGQAGGK